MQVDGEVISACLMPAVFVDGRAEVYYASGTFDDEIRIHNVSGGWRETLDRRGVQVVLTDRSGALARALQQTAGWTQVFTGRVEAVFTRTGPREGKG